MAKKIPFMSFINNIIKKHRFRTYHTNSNTSTGPGNFHLLLSLPRFIYEHRNISFCLGGFRILDVPLHSISKRNMRILLPGLSFGRGLKYMVTRYQEPVTRASSATLFLVYLPNLFKINEGSTFRKEKFVHYVFTGLF